jgi:hypothetical protein
MMSDEPDFTAPVIIVGPGRSGTTLLGETLGAHPNFHMIGESNFLFRRLWNTLHESPDFSKFRRLSKLARQTRPDWRELPWYTFATEVAGPAMNKLRDLSDAIAATENERIAQELGSAFARMLIPPTLRRRYWGMQEIWIGSDSFPYSFELYETAFPRAKYIQSIRNPLIWIRSVFNNNQVVASMEDAINALEQWVKMTTHARTLTATGRYMEFRHEDFVGDAGRTAERVFAFVGLDFSEQCRQTLDIRHLPSTGPNEFLDRAGELLAAVPGLREEMADLGYVTNAS